MDKYKNLLYSRQIGTIGKECMKQLSNMTVYIYHIDTIGFEVAKCLTLMGVHQILLHDSRIPDESHRGLNIAIQPGSTDTIAVQTQRLLQELNPFVHITIVPNESSEIDIFTEYDIDVCIQTALHNNNHITVSNYCHEHNIAYIFGYQYQFSGYIFTDFSSHTIYNPNGESLKTSFVSTIIPIHHTNNQTELQLTLTEQMDFTVGDYIHFQFPNDQQSTFSNECIWKITKKHNQTIHITYGSTFDYTYLLNTPNIVIREYIYPKTIEYKSFSHYLDHCIYTPDVIGHMGVSCQSMEVIQYIHSRIKNTEGDHEDSFIFPIIGSIIGAIIAQEVIKTTGIYTPIHQQFIIDYSELLPVSNTPICIDGMDPYTHIHNALSQDMIDSLSSLKVFLVGCGALGCEYLKFFHQLDMSRQPSSLITVTDMDHIELSNLNRQFLFRENDIGQSKSITAAAKITSINQDIRIQALDKELSVKIASANSTEQNHFDASFWSSQDIIVNALDNVITRQFVDQQCVLYEKPLFETGTLGTKCNVQVIIPHQTITYSETQDPPQKTIPVCTIKNFPYTIDHCISWGLELFEFHFTIVMNSLRQLYTEPNEFSKQEHSYSLLLHVYYLYSCIESKQKYHKKALIRYILSIIYTTYIGDIQTLQTTYPKDHTQDDGSLFWSGHKIYPNIIDLHVHKDKVYEYVETLYSILSTSIPCMCTPPLTEHDHCIIDTYIHTMKYQEYTLENVLDISHPISSSDTKTSSNILYQHISTIQAKDKRYKQIPKIILPQSFDKDCLDSHHIECITLVSNFRATNYNIEHTTISACRLIAGNIIPAISTTTTLVTALSIMEILKYVSATQITHADHFINMGVNTFIQSEPMDTIIMTSGFNPLYGCEVVAKPHPFSIWDKIIITCKDHCLHTLQDIIAYIQDILHIHISLLSIGQCILYMEGQEDQLYITIEDIYKRYNDSNNTYIQLNCSDFEEGALVICPTILLSN